MDWVFDNLQLIIVIAGAIAYWINQRRREKMGEPADYDEDGIPENRPDSRKFKPEAMDADEAERTRRIQEEIRRKIAERMQGKRAEPPPLVAPRPVAQPLPPVLTRRLETKPPVVPTPPRRSLEEEEDAERQRKIAEQWREVEARRAEARRLATEASNAAMRIPQQGASTEKVLSTDATLLQQLRDTRSVRRAFILRELLGPPAGLK
jgi:hypothetical protein